MNNIFHKQVPVAYIVCFTLLTKIRISTISVQLPLC